MIAQVSTELRLLFLIVFNRPFKLYDCSNSGAFNVKPVSLICKMLPYSGPSQNLGKTHFIVGLSLKGTVSRKSWQDIGMGS
jgi:hypothetical protein